MQVRIGLLGCGRIGRMHADLLRARVPGAELAAVYDVVADAAAQVGQELGVKVAATVDEVLGADVDAVAICTSTETHADLIVAAAAARKHVFCEKPVSLELAEVDRVLDAVSASDTILQVGFNRRFDPSHRAVAGAVGAGRIGRPELVRITSRDPVPPPLDYLRVSGGIFLDMTVHDFDMARYVVGDEVEEVYATGAALTGPAIAEAGDLDTVLIQLRYRSGALGVIDNSRRAVYGYDQRVEVLGSEGLARSDNLRPHSAVVETAGGRLGPPVVHFFLERYVPSYIAEWASFVRAVLDGTEPEVTGSDGRASLVLGLAALRSVAERRPVTVREIGA